MAAEFRSSWLGLGHRLEGDTVFVGNFLEDELKQAASNRRFL
jgi:hypothetical protein